MLWAGVLSTLINVYVYNNVWVFLENSLHKFCNVILAIRILKAKHCLKYIKATLPKDFDLEIYFVQILK